LLLIVTTRNELDMLTDIGKNMQASKVG
jgi:hypothetical protein